MASTITHIVVGERAFAELQWLNQADFGSFLLGCVLVDVHCAGSVDRPTTHFANRFDEYGIHAYDRSCSNFLSQLDSLLLRPWSNLTSAEQAFVAGYLCHLAADEDWKRFDLNTICTLGIRWWRDLPVPVSVVLTAFDAMSSELYHNPVAIAHVLSDISVPHVVTHIPQNDLEAWWEAIRPRAIDGGRTESYFEVLRRLGKTETAIELARCEHDKYWEEALEVVCGFFGGVESRIQAMVERSLGALPRLWE